MEEKYTENPLDDSCEFNAHMGARRVDEQLHEALVMGRGITGCEQVVRNVEQHMIEVLCDVPTPRPWAEAVECSQDGGASAAEAPGSRPGLAFLVPSLQHAE